jgi:peptidoglycan/xylan/chitin deacetylase (PgdA/CDA1 family)
MLEAETPTMRTRLLTTTLVTSIGLAVLALPASLATAADCPGNPAALGTERVLAVDPAATPAVGRKQFPVTLPLGPKEVVLTFDDGPWPGTTDRVLAALRHECVRATFFELGRNAIAHPALARRELAEGHTVGYHTFSHPLLNRMPVERAEVEIDRGIGAIDTVLYGEASRTPKTPFFRFPGFASSPALLERLARRGISVFGADLWPGDWNPMSPEHEREILLQRLASTGGGIVLLHDTQAKTAAMLPGLLRELKRRDYRVVHVVPAGAALRR